MRVLVTGAAGFLGTAVCRHLKNNGDEVYGVDLHRSAGRNFVTTVTDLRKRNPAENPDPNNLLDVGFSFLEVNDAADLVTAVLSSDQTGYKQYFPTAEQNRLGWSVIRIIEQFYPHVPLRLPIHEMHNIVDISSITETFNWLPVNSRLDID